MDLKSITVNDTSWVRLPPWAPFLYGDNDNSIEPGFSLRVILAIFWIESSMNIKNEKLSDLLEWFESEVKIHHYDPFQTPPRAPYTLDELRDELEIRLGIN